MYLTSVRVRVCVRGAPRDTAIHLPARCEPLARRGLHGAPRAPRAAPRADRARRAVRRSSLRRPGQPGAPRRIGPSGLLRTLFKDSASRTT